MLVEMLEKQSRISSEQLWYLALTASHRYKTYRIPKRNGGTRVVHHPGRKIKAIQRWLNKNLILNLPVHNNATAYKKNTSIRKNAEKHVNSSFTLRLDFQNFFPSFQEAHVQEFLSNVNEDSQLKLTRDDISFIRSITARYGCLTIGAPTSPSLTNAMMYDFDAAAEEYAKRSDLTFTRYADDLFISSERANRLGDVEQELTMLVENHVLPTLTINSQKTAYLSRRYRRTITGLVITPDHKISVGRGRKRELKALVHRFINGRLGPNEKSYLKGLLAFVSDVEPVFLESLSKKYGNDAVSKLLHNN